MIEKMVVIMLNSDPSNANELFEPIYQAIIAASMDYNVEIILSGRSGELAIRGVAEKITSPRKENETIYDILKEAYQSGVKIRASKFVTQRWNEEELIPEIDEVVSGGYVIGEIMNDNNITLTY